MISIIGWDIGGANVKAAWLALKQGRTEAVRVASRPFEIWREKDRLPEMMRTVVSAIAPAAPPQAMAVTMTAELSDVFTAKREGVLYVLECVEASFPEVAGYALSLSGEFVPLDKARNSPLDFASANWLASALWIARKFPNCLLVDVGSTTTDILPILDGEVRMSGRTDLARLSSGELVFTGALRTNVAAIVQSVPVRKQLCRVASEYFSISGDVNLILGYLRPEDYTCTTPDGQPPSNDSARRRLARLVCADTDMLSAAEIKEIAWYIHEQQVRQIKDGLNQVISRMPQLRSHPVIALGIGAFLGEAAARSLGMQVLDILGEWGCEEMAVAPCLAAAHLLAEHMKAG